jgi:DNA repair photolyase
MSTDIQAKVLLSNVPQPDTWFGLKYNMNLYRGCQHGCIYCDSRSKCYGIEDFTNIQVKVNATELLKKELGRKRTKGTIGTGSMNDPYMPLEADRQLTRRALEVITAFRFPVHILTKSDLVLRDVDLLADISREYAAVSFTITTADDELGKKVEPGAPFVSRRFQAMEKLASRGILAGVLMMPVLPFLEDSPAHIRELLLKAKAYGAAYVLPSFGMTLRDRQRQYYYLALDRLFPGVRQNYERKYGNQYFAPARHARELEIFFNQTCQELNLASRMPVYKKVVPKQQSFLI